MMTRLAILATAAMLLGGCAAVSPEAVRAGDVRACDAYGFKRGTTAFAECLQRRDIARDVERRERVYPGGVFYGTGIGIGTGFAL